MVEFLLQQGTVRVTLTAIKSAARNGCVEVLKLFLDPRHGVPEHEVQAALYQAIRSGQGAVVDFLLPECVVSSLEFDNLLGV